MPSIKDQSILIIRGSSGIGFAVAQLALKQGCHVSIASSNPGRISNAVTRLTSPSLSSQISGHTIDLSTADVEASLQSLFKAVTKDGTQLLDHVISTAIPPISMPKTLQEVDGEELLRLGQFSNVVPNFMKGDHNSSLILTSGAIAEKPIKGWSVMVPGAIAFYGMVKALALE
jgi:NAD(P)-dependent dehydrogenase (short-subunit alcohol dehydrogenase family)